MPFSDTDEIVYEPPKASFSDSDVVVAEPSEAPSRGGYLTEVARGLTQFAPAAVKTASVIGEELLDRPALGVGPSGRSVLRSFGVDTVPDAVPESRPLYRAGEWMEDALDRAYPAVAEPQRNLGHDVASGLGQVGSMLAGGIAARAAGATLKGAAWAGTALGFGMEFDDAFTRSRQRGDDPDTAFAKALGYGTISALIENKLGAGRIIKKYFPDPAIAAQKLSALGISKAVGTSLAIGFGEEGSQRFAQNWIVEGQPSLEGVVREGAPGGVVQAIAELPATLLRGVGRVRRAQQSLPPITEVPDAIRQPFATFQMLGDQEAQPEINVGLQPVVARNPEPQTVAATQEEVRQSAPSIIPTQEVALAAPLNPGGAQADLPPEVQAMSVRSNSLAAFAEANGVPYVEGDTGPIILEKIKAKAAPVPAQVQSKPPELMTPDEFYDIDGRRQAPKDLAGQQRMQVIHKQYLDTALVQKQPVSKAAADKYYWQGTFSEGAVQLPAGYVREADQYVFAPSPANAPKETGPSSGAVVTTPGVVPVMPQGTKATDRAFMVQWYDLEGDVRESGSKRRLLTFAEADKVAKETDGWVTGWDENGKDSTIVSYLPKVTTPTTRQVEPLPRGQTGKLLISELSPEQVKALANSAGVKSDRATKQKLQELEDKGLLDSSVLTPAPAGDVAPKQGETETRTTEPAPNLGTGLAEGQGMSPDEVRAAIAGESTAGFVVEVVSKADAEVLTGKPEARGYGGFFWKGKVHLVHENMARGDAAGAKALLREEVGHGLLRTAEGAKQLQAVLAAGRLQLTEAEKQALRDQGYGEANLLDEFIAKSARENLPWWKAAVEQVRVWLSKVGLANLTNEEVARLLLKQIQRANEGANSFADAALPALAPSLPTATPETSPIGDKPPVIAQVQGVPIGIEREAENIAAIQQTIRAQIFDGTQPVSDATTAQARALFGRMTDPSQKAAAVGEVLSITNAQMGPGLTLAELWRYAEQMVLTNSDDSFLREIVPHYQDFGLGESGAGATAFGRGLRALQETDTLLPQLYEIEKERRAAARQKMAVGPELLEELLAALKGEISDADMLERKTRTVLGTKVKPEKVDEIVRVVRRKPVDPVTELINHFAGMAGVSPITPEQHKRLVGLAQKLTNSDLSIPERSELMDQMFSVFNTMKLPPSLLTRLASNLVATNLTGLRTLGVNIFSPNVQGLVELGLTGITSPRDFPAMLRGAIEGGKQWLTNIRYSMGRDAYSFLNNDYQAAQNVLKQIWQRGLVQIKSNSASERTRGLTNLIFGSQQYYMRLLNSVDNANGILRRQMQLALYSSQAMRKLGMGTAEIRDVADMFYLMRDQFYAQSIESGLTENQSKIRANALAYQEFVEFLNNELPSGTGSEIAKAATYEATSVLGRIAEGVNEIDEGGLVTRTVGAPLLYLSNWMRKQEGLMPAIGVALLGYVNVPYRTARYYAWNTPYGLVRLGINKWRKSKGKESWWKQSLATEFQEQQRLKNALAGSAILTALTGLGIGLLKTSGDDGAGDDDDDGVYFTGNGPKNKNLRSAWIAKGFKPQSLVIFIDGKPVSVEMSRSGEAFAHYAWLLAARDDRKWREKEATANNRQYITTPTKEAAYAIGTYFGLLGQRGIFQTLTQAGNVASGQSDPMAFAASKGGSFISGLFTPALGLQRSVQGLLEGPVDTSSVQSAFMANFPALNIMGLTHPKVNAFGDKLYNPENAWFHKMRDTGIPIAFSTNPTTENKRLYGLLVEKGVAPRELRRAVVEEKYGPLSDDQFAQFAERSGRLVKQQVLNNEPTLRNMPPENVKKWLGKTTLNADALTAKGMGLEPVKPPTASTSPSASILPPMSASIVPGATAAVPGATMSVPRRTSGLSRISVGRRSYGPSLSRSLGRPRFSTVRGLGRRRSIVGRIGRRRATRPRRLRALVGRRRRVVRL